MIEAYARLPGRIYLINEADRATMTAPKITFERRDDTRYPCYYVVRDGKRVGLIERPTVKAGWCCIVIDANGDSTDDDVWWCGPFSMAKKGARKRFGGAA